MSRIDDIINVAGHRLSTGAMEEVLASHPDVAECAVIGAADALKGQVPIGLVVLKSGVGKAHDEIARELIRSEEHTSELQSLMRISYAVFCLKKKNKNNQTKSVHETTKNTKVSR